jgi:outer membrane protein assembly factor BamB
MFFATPVVAGGRVFIGSMSGIFYAINERTGALLWQRDVGFVGAHTCGARGVTGSAAVAPEAAGGGTVYVPGGHGTLFAFDAVTGSQRWRAVIANPSPSINDYYNWSSVALSGNTMYVGVSSQCDHPFVPGGVKSFDRRTGHLIAHFTSVPPGRIGGGVWTTPAASMDGRHVFLTTASGPPGVPGVNSLFELNGATLRKEASWSIPDSEQVTDSDFGSSPVMFQADVGHGSEPLVAACNKNGILYAWRLAAVAAGPTWRLRAGVGTPRGLLSCLSAPVWTGTALYAASNETTIGGRRYPGAIRRLNPVNGQPLWETGLPGNVLGSPSINGAGLLAVPIYGTTGSTGLALVRAADGRLLRFIANAGATFAQPVFVDNLLLTASLGRKLTAWSSSGGG